MRCSATRRNGRNMTSMEKTGNTPTSSKPNSSNIANIKRARRRSLLEQLRRRQRILRLLRTDVRRHGWQRQTQPQFPRTRLHDRIAGLFDRCCQDTQADHHRKRQNLRITIPAGIADGQTIKLRGQGGPGVNGGPAGDLYITFHIPEDSRFKRVGDDLYVTVPLNLYTAILGGEQIVETMDSKAKLKVKPGTQNNTKVRLRGKGFPVYKEEGKFGDMIVTYSIDIPTNLTDKQKELFREIQSLN